ncbi:sialic acid-binding Ig-like lectin 14 [Pimephales promelas]|uniref:sialic acid-binding Ig-like lectin 14 n=1 Tax=Pimephales promelas TaxID=90988 RepID=UPI001955C1B4|nr:sialic acid-binding Ig-like lectin 14 [Pimephales promelas]
MNKAEKIILFSFLLQGVCCRNFNINLSAKIQVLSGSCCVIIKCTFEIENTFDKALTESSAIGIWYKDGHDVEHQVFNSSVPNSNHFKGAITGKLHKKNCTTIFYNVSSNHNGKYYFRIESGDLKYTYKQNTSTVNVNESPPKPTVKLYKDQDEDEEEVLEGSSVSLRCSAETLCSSPPPTLTWSFTPRIPFSESGRQQERLVSDLNFTATHRHHGVTFTCTITYQLQDKNKTAQDYITLHVQYAPKISPSSNCRGTNETVCLCEGDGNPSPVLEWYLSGRPVSNSSNTFISEERLNGTGLRSYITLRQSLSHTYTLQCVGNNTHGTASKLLLSVARLNVSSVMIGVAVAAVLVIMFSAITCICVRKKVMKLVQTKREGATKNIPASDAVPHEDEAESVYANDFVMSSTGTATENPKSFIYSSIDFTAKSLEFTSASSLHDDNTLVQHCSVGMANAENSMDESSGAIEAQVIVKEDVVTKQTKSKESEKELLADSSQLYAVVKRRNP